MSFLTFSTFMSRKKGQCGSLKTKHGCAYCLYVNTCTLLTSTFVSIKDSPICQHHKKLFYFEQYSLCVVVDGVVADEQRGVESFGQQRVDGDHHQQHRQLQHRVQPQKHGARHHRQDPRKHKILREKKASDGFIRSSGPWFTSKL